uniref:GH18 domain-containing protein n=1 Tax=Clytia hemisphaerica TaxID=252671 RepID=A0A7M5XJ72_9CNID
MEPKVGLFWGQNEAYNKFGVKAQEASLKSFCDRGIYDVIILRGVQHCSFNGKLAAMPALNFANHCHQRRSAWYAKYQYLECPSMEDDIRYCQVNGVKILLDIGGLGYHIIFSSRTEALEFSKQIWFAFLGNWRYSTRTFGQDIILDGINLSLHSSANPFMSDFLHDLRDRMENDWKKTYLITASPPCYKESYSFFQTYSKVFDRIFIDFTLHRRCEYKGPSSGQSKVDFLLDTDWFTRDTRPELRSFWFVLSASSFTKGLYLTRGEIDELVKKSKHRKITLKGIVLNEASFDAHNMDNGETLSMTIYRVMGGSLQQAKQSIENIKKKKEGPPVCKAGSLCLRDRNASSKISPPYFTILIASIVFM